MFWSRLFIPTLRDPNAGLLQRAGYSRQRGWLFLGQRSLLKIAAIVRHEMAEIGAQETAATAARELRSYKQLPQIWFQIETALRSYSFDLTAGGWDTSRQKHRDAFRRILDRCGLEYLKIDDGFAVRSDSGDDLLVECPGCGYAGFLDTAVSRTSAPALADPEGDLTPEEFHTPDKKTIADIAEFTGLPETTQMKSLVMVAGGQGVLALVRGDHQMSEAKFAQALGATEVRPATPQDIFEWFGAEAGSLGPVGVKGLRVVADRALEGRRNMISGANRTDYHLRHVTPGEDFQPEYFDLRQFAAGDTCAKCGHALRMVNAVELARIRATGKAADVHVTDETGQEVTPRIGSYSLAIERILSVAAVQHADKDGMSLAPSVAPFYVVITPVNMSTPELREAGQAIYDACRDSGLDAVLDDRDERPGVKFKDADLVGIPYRVNIGKKLAQGLVEVVERRTKRTADVAVTEVVAYLKGQ